VGDFNPALHASAVGADQTVAETLLI
jgi:hypothetical protein